MEQRILRMVLIQLKIAAALLLISLFYFLYLCASPSAVTGLLHDQLPAQGHQENQFITSAALKDEPGYARLSLHVVAVYPATVPNLSRLNWQ